MNISYYTHLTDKINISELGFSSPGSYRAIGPYVRSTYLLHIVTSGVMHFCDFDVNVGEAVFISKNKLHSFWVDKGYSHFWFAFDGNGARDFLIANSINPEKHSLLKISKPDYAKTLFENARLFSENSHEIALSAFYGFFPLINDRRVSPDEPSVSIAFLAKTYIESNYQRKFSMEELAKYACVSEKYLCTLFKRQYKMPPQQYLQQVRMNTARALLTSTDIKIKEVACSVGYASQLAFSCEFKKHFGQAPSELRKANQSVLPCENMK